MTIGLTITDLVAGYGETVVLDGLSLAVEAGGTLAILGRNGVGKTTLLETIMGLTHRHSGSIRLGDRAIETVPTHERARLGLGYVPQQREIFPSLTVTENLAVSARPGGWTSEAVFTLFPSLAERRNNSGNRLSGGEQQMLALGRALVGAPKILLLDEPLEGLAPIVIEAIFEALSRIRDESGITMVLIEQKPEMALAFAQNVAVLERGKVVHYGACTELRGNEARQNELLGVSH